MAAYEVKLVGPKGGIKAMWITYAETASEAIKGVQPPWGGYVDVAREDHGEDLLRSVCGNRRFKSVGKY